MFAVRKIIFMEITARYKGLFRKVVYKYSDISSFIKNQFILALIFILYYMLCLDP